MVQKNFRVIVTFELPKSNFLGRYYIIRCKHSESRSGSFQAILAPSFSPNALRLGLEFRDKLQMDRIHYNTKLLIR